jgi:hypothetical protein
MFRVKLYVQEVYQSIDNDNDNDLTAVLSAQCLVAYAHTQTRQRPAPGLEDQLQQTATAVKSHLGGPTSSAPTRYASGERVSPPLCNKLCFAPLPGRPVSSTHGPITSAAPKLL